jgi:hypothetical protein
MGKFRRVAETQGVPDYIEKQFLPESQQKQDIYAHLREAAVRHKQVVASETLGDKSPVQAKKDWERVTKAEKYEQPMLRPQDEQLSNLSPYDLSSRSIRRTGSQMDEGENARPGNFQWGSKQDVVTALIRGASIFDSDMETLSEHLVEENEQRVAMAAKSLEQRRDAEHRSWEKTKMQELRPRRYASSRANPILRTSVDNVVAGGFGVADYGDMERKELQRQAMMDAKRERQQAISRVGEDPIEKRRKWEEGLDPYADSYQTYQSDWLDDFNTE